MYEVREDGLYWKDRWLGGRNDIIVDVHQDLANHPAVQTVKLEVGDYAMVTGEGRLILIEEKRLPDLVSSWRGRRLQRQLRKLQQYNEQGINVLGLRGAQTLALMELPYYSLPNDIALDLMKWQVLGGLLGMLPPGLDALVNRLREWRAVLQPGHHLLSVLSGDDRGKVRGGSPTAQALRRLLPGAGPAIAGRWAEAAGESLQRALSMSDEELTEAGVRANVRARLREVWNG